MGATPEQKKAFVEALQKVFEHPNVELNGTLPPLSVQTRALIIAHAAYESGWGIAKAARVGFNFWNLTAGSLWKGEVVMGNDTEYEAGKSAAKAIVQRFRKYGSPVGAVIDYVKFLSTPRYADGKAKLMKGDSTFVVDIGLYKYGPDGKPMLAWQGLTSPKGGFYTLPIERYAKEFELVLAEVKNIVGIC